jgi:hypothetical protein
MTTLKSPPGQNHPRERLYQDAESVHVIAGGNAPGSMARIFPDPEGIAFWRVIFDLFGVTIIFWG